MSKVLTGGVRFSKSWLTDPLRFRNGSSYAIASRYGRITLATLQIFAYFQRSSNLHLRLRRHSRSASIATSRPILLRYLKQSATVFAGQYSRTVTPSILWDSTPDEKAASENLITRSRGVSTRGRAAFRSSAIQHFGRTLSSNFVETKCRK